MPPGFSVPAAAALRYNDNAYGTHRRRRVGSYYETEWCIVTATGSREGAFMECQQCYRLYGNWIERSTGIVIVRPKHEQFEIEISDTWRIMSIYVLIVRLRYITHKMYEHEFVYIQLVRFTGLVVPGMIMINANPHRQIMKYHGCLEISWLLDVFV